MNAPSSASSGGEEKSGKPMGLIIGAVVGVLALAGAGWYFMKGSSQPAENAEATETAARPRRGGAAAKGARPSRRSTKCSRKRASPWTSAATSSRTRTTRSNTSARCWCSSRATPEATEGLKRLGGLLIARARTALDERRFDNALAELEAARSIDPNDQRLVEVDARLDSMRAQTALAQIQATLAAQNFDRAQTLLDAAQKDALLPPAQIAQLSKELDGKRRSVTISRLVASAEARLVQRRS